MARTKGLEVDRRVGIALSVLPSAQKLAVQRVIRTPQSFAAFAAQPGRVRQMATSGQPLYMMRISPSLRLIYTTVGDTVLVLDVVERATLNHFAARRAAERATKDRMTKESPGAAAKKAPHAVKE